MGRKQNPIKPHVIAMYNLGYKYKEIGEMVGKPTNYVCAMIGAARKQGKIFDHRYLGAALAVVQQDPSKQHRLTEGYDCRRNMSRNDRVRKAARLAYQRRPIADLAYELGVCESTFSLYIKHAKERGLLPEDFDRRDAFFNPMYPNRMRWSWSKTL